MPETKLNYSFTTTPNPVVVSIGGDSPAHNFVDLLVMIDNGGLPVGNVKKITIEIATGGSESSGSSSSTSGPAPSTAGNCLSDSGLEAATLIRYDTNSPWDINPSGSTIVISPKSTDTPGTVQSTIMFKLQNILVNQTPGNVSINITEEIPIAPPRPALVSSIAKVDANYPVKDFYVELNGVRLDPPALYDQDVEGVLVKWVCTSAGEHNTYQLFDGLTALMDAPQSPSSGTTCPVDLAHTSTLSLNVFDPGGNTIDTLSLTVHVEKPYFEGDIHQYSICSGRLVRLHWTADDAAGVTMKLQFPDSKLSDKLVDNHAPANTYRDGYWMSTGNDAIKYGFYLEAFAGLGTVTAPYTSFEEVVVQPTSTLSSGEFNSSVAITPDNQKVLTGGFESPFKLIDIASGATSQIADTLSTPQFSGIAVTPDGKFALMFDGNGLSIFEIDAPQNLTVSATVECGLNVPIISGIFGNSPICVTSDGTLALVLSSNQLLFIDDIAHGHVAKSIDMYPGLPSSGNGGSSIAVTPDGKWAFAAANRNPGEIILIDVVNQLRTTTVVASAASGQFFNDLAVTPDGSDLLVVDNGGQRILVIEIEQAQTFPTVKTIPLSTYPTSIAITPDSQLAMVTVTNTNQFGTGAGGSLAVIDIARGVILMNIPFAETPIDVAIMTGDKATLLTPTVTDAAGNTTGGTPIRAVVGTYEGSAIII